MSDRGGRFWAAVPVVLLGTLVGSLGLVAIIASDDPGFAVERDYYKKAVDWDETQRQAATNQRLGWKLELDTRAPAETRSFELDARVLDASGAPIRGAVVKVEAFPNARAGNIVHARFESGESGSGEKQHARLPLSRSGLWELRFTVDARGERFTETIRRDIIPGDPT